METNGGEWVPLSVRESGDTEDYTRPLDNVPDWLFTSLWDYLEVALDDVDKDELYIQVRQMERRLHKNLDVPRGFPGAVLDALQEQMQRDDKLCLDALDFLLQFVIDPAWTAPIASVLREAGSAWTVTKADDNAHLSRRVGDAAQSRAEKAIAVGDRCSRHLTEAWKCVFGRHPDGQKGYDQVVKAVECAAQLVVSPRNATTTLGTAIADMRAKPSKWAVRLTHPDPERQVLTVVDVMDVLWKGQHRHGVPDVGAPMGNTDEEADGAVQIGLTLVEWFRSGFVYRVGP